jgi:ACR3 family arsenite transporter
VTAATAPDAAAGRDQDLDGSVLQRLSTLDRFLPLWIGLAMVAGLALGRALPGLNDDLDRVKVDTTSLPIAAGLLGMMYPVLAKVRYGRIREAASDRPMLLSSLLLNWLVGPALMFALAWTFLADLPEFRTGVVLIGLARCIAMVLIWNSLACGDGEAAAVLVVLNSVFQVAAYSLLGYFYLELLPGWLGLDQATVHFALWDIAKSVLVFLGVPLVAGLVTSVVGRSRKGDAWYETRFLPRLGPFALYSLLFTVVVLFAIQGDSITHRPLDVARIALPLVCYFGLMWTASFAWGRLQGMSYERTTTLAFTAAGNNFELAIAVAIATFGVDSGQALAGVVGPLIEVPALVTLVYAALWARRRLFRGSVAQPEAVGPAKPVGTAAALTAAVVPAEAEEGPR